MGTVRCKFECISEKKYKGYSKDNPYMYSYEFNVVYSDGIPEHKEFFAATPGGKLELSTIKSAMFLPGTLYYLDIIPA